MEYPFPYLFKKYQTINVWNRLKWLHNMDKVVSVIEDCLADGRTAEWNNFMVDNAIEFEDNESKEKSSVIAYTHRHHDIHAEFCSILELQFTENCARHGLSCSEFYDGCRENEEKESIVEIFVTLINMSAEFSLFADVMRSREKRDYFFHIIKSYRMSMVPRK